MNEMINDKWSVSFDRKKWVNVDLPYNLVNLPEEENKKKKIHLKRHIRLKPDKKKRYFIFVRNIMGNTRFRINGHTGGNFKEFSGEYFFEITPFIKLSNELSMQISPLSNDTEGTVLNSVCFKQVENAMLEKCEVKSYTVGNTLFVNSKMEINSFLNRRKEFELISFKGDETFENKIILNPGLNIIELFHIYRSTDLNELRMELRLEGNVEDEYITDIPILVESACENSERICSDQLNLEKLISKFETENKEKEVYEIKNNAVLGEDLLGECDIHGMKLNVGVLVDTDKIDIFCTSIRNYMSRLNKFNCINVVTVFVPEHFEYLEKYINTIKNELNASFFIKAKIY